VTRKQKRKVPELISSFAGMFKECGQAGEIRKKIGEHISKMLLIYYDKSS